MRKASLFVSSLMLFLSLIFVPLVHSSINPADYHWQFWVGGLRIWVQYPEECRPGDSISYNVLIYSSVYPQGNYIDEIKVTISVPISQTEWKQLFDAWIYKDILMPYGNEYNKTITVVVPKEAWWYITIVLDVSTHSGDMTEHTHSNLALSSTIVRDKTYEELRRENFDLWSNYTYLKNEYESYKSSHSYSNSEYNNLNSTYNQYVQSHSHSNHEYDELQSAYVNLISELGIAKTLNYIIIAITTVFIASTIYFARKKSK